MEPVNSTTFIKRPPSTSRGEDTLFEAREILLNRLFLGHYEERRRVDDLQEYRDVVIISPAETELINDIEKIRINIVKYCNAKWVGITTQTKENGSINYCFWVKLINIPFGHFWFQIKQIKCEQGEIILRLKCLRPFRSQDLIADSVNDSTKSETEIRSESMEPQKEYSFEFDPVQKFTSMCNVFNDSVRQVKPHLTGRNFLLLCKFICAVGFVLICGMITCIRYLGDFVLRLIRELSFFLHTITPILLQTIDCFSKIIGGILIFITYFFKQRNSQQMQNPYQLQQRLPPELSPSQRLSLTYKSSHSRVNQSKTDLPYTPDVKTVISPPNWRERNRAIMKDLHSN